MTETLQQRTSVLNNQPTTTTTTVSRPLCRDHPSEPVPEERFF